MVMYPGKTREIRYAKRDCTRLPPSLNGTVIITYSVLPSWNTLALAGEPLMSSRAGVCFIVNTAAGYSPSPATPSITAALSRFDCGSVVWGLGGFPLPPPSVCGESDAPDAEQGEGGGFGDGSVLVGQCIVKIIHVWHTSIMAGT